MTDWLGHDNGFRPAVWKNTKTGRQALGQYRYNWASETFSICLEQIGARKCHENFNVHGDTPEWGAWRLVRTD